MASIGLDLGLGGIFRQLLITAADIVSAWPLSEMVKATARDIANDRNPGTWSGTGTTRGVSVDLPEGALGATFDGNGYVQVADDGDGYRLPGDSGGRNLSLAGGDIDISCLLKQNASYAARVMSAGPPAGYWRLNESAGPTATDSAGSNNGTYVNAPTFGVSSAIADGTTAVTFVSSGDGAADAGSYATAPMTAPGTTWSLECWLKKSAAASGSAREFLSANGGAGDFIEIFITTSATNILVAKSGVTVITGAVNVCNGQWHHIVVTCDGAQTKLYVDGAQDGSTYAGTINITGTTLNIGRWAGGGFTIGGSMDDVARYSAALSSTEIAAHYAARTFTSSDLHSTKRAIVQKQDTDSNGNGWHVAEQYGQIRFKLRVSGTDKFDVARGFVTDGALHLVQCTYDASTGDAKMLIDGVQAGATVSIAPVDPATTTATLRIGKFNDGNGGFVGTLCYVAVSRNGNPSLSASLQATRSWTDVTAHVRNDPMALTTGTSGTTVNDRQAGMGTLSFALSNTPTIAGVVTEGYYTIGHANCRAGFDLNIPVRLRVGSRVLFRGRVRQADPEAGLYRAKRVFAIASDWFDVAAMTPIEQIDIGINMRSDEAWAALIDEADQPPVAVSRTAGSETFPFVFDRVSGPILSEMAAVVASEGGYGYIRPDTTTGGVVTYEPRTVRQIATTPVATFNATMHELEVQIRQDALVNVVQAALTPRRIGSGTTTVLYAQTNRQVISPGDSIVVKGSYQDPTQSRSAIGGTDFQEPLLAGTDYTGTENEDGSGNVLTSNLSVTAQLGGSGFELTIRNGSAISPVWVAYQIRGRALYTDAGVTVKQIADASLRARGPHVYDAQYRYLNSPETARSLSLLVLSLFAEPTAVPAQLVFRPAAGSSLETTVLALAPGDLIGIGEAMTAVTTTQHFWIQNARFTFHQPGLVEAEFGIFPSFATGDIPFGVWDSSNWDECLSGF